MGMITTIHIAGGSISLIAGAAALCATKGSKAHRKSGLLFVLAMLLMLASAFPLAVVVREPTSLMGGALTLYMVMTSFLAVRRSPCRFDWVSIGVALSALSISAIFFLLAFKALGSESGTIDDLTPEPMFFFGAVALLAAMGDIRVILVAELSRSYRLARHLWRMCFAFFMAVTSFFIGQAQIIPEPLRIPALLSFFPVAVMVMMVYWLVRVWWVSRRRAASDP